MIVYIIFFLFSLLVYFVFGKKNKKFYCAVIGIFILLLMAFRNPSLGMYDVEDNYIPLFYKLKYLSFREIFQNYYASGILFYLISKIIAFLLPYSNVWLLILAVPIVLSISKLIYKCSQNAWLSFFLFFTLGYFECSVTILRQTVSISFCLFAILSEIDKKKMWKTILLIILAFGFHPTGILSILIIPLFRFKKDLSLKFLFLTIISAFVIWEFSPSIIEVAFKYISIENFQRYFLHLSSFNATMLLIHMAIFVFACVSFLFSKEKQGTNEKYLIRLLSLSLIFFGLTSSFSALYRLALYFSIVEIVAIPNALNLYKDKKTRLILTISIVGICLYYGVVRGMLNVIPYETFF